MKNVKYSEPADFIPKDLREKYKIGEYYVSPKDKLLQMALESLRMVKSGERIRVYDLVEQYQNDYPDIINNPEDLFWIVAELRKKAKREGIDIFSGTRDLVMGLPYNIPGIVRRKVDKAKYSKETCVEIRYEEGGSMNSAKAIDCSIKKGNMTEESWDLLLSKIFDNTKVLNWYDCYDDPFIMDGWYWNLTLYFENGKSLKFSGSNAAPSYLKKLKSAIRPYSK